MTASNEHVCARCPKLLGASCCEPKAGEKLATLTRADVERIRAHVRRAASAFVDEDVLSHDDARDYEARRPLYRGYFWSGPVRLTLKQQGGAGACVFHTAERGCALPADVRPLACRLYPFEQFPDGSWSVQVGRYGSLESAREATDACLAIEEAEGMDDVLRAFGTTREAIEALGEELREAVRKHASPSPLGRGTRPS